MSPLNLPSWVWHTTTTTSYSSDPKGALRRDVSERRLFGMVLFSNTHEESVGEGRESDDADADVDIDVDVDGDVGTEMNGAVVQDAMGIDDAPETRVHDDAPSPAHLAQRSRQGSAASASQRYETRRHSDAAVAQAEV